MRFENGELIDMDLIIIDKLEPEQHVWVILKEDLALMEAENNWLIIKCPSTQLTMKT